MQAFTVTASIVPATRTQATMVNAVLISFPIAKISISAVPRLAINVRAPKPVRRSHSAISVRPRFSGFFMIVAPCGVCPTKMTCSPVNGGTEFVTVVDFTCR